MGQAKSLAWKREEAHDQRLMCKANLSMTKHVIVFTFSFVTLQVKCSWHPVFYREIPGDILMETLSIQARWGFGARRCRTCPTVASSKTDAIFTGVRRVKSFVCIEWDTGGVTAALRERDNGGKKLQHAARNLSGCVERPKWKKKEKKKKKERHSLQNGFFNLSLC